MHRTLLEISTAGQGLAAIHNSIIREDNLRQIFGEVPTNRLFCDQ
jgi:hypothetical protein